MTDFSLSNFPRNILIYFIVTYFYLKHILQSIFVTTAKINVFRYKSISTKMKLDIYFCPFFIFVLDFLQIVL